MTLKATVLRILYPKTDVSQIGAATWWVLSTSSGKVVGSSRILFKEHHTYIFEGDFSSYQGQLNFKFASVKKDIPVDPRAILKYACTITHGIGESFAEQTWQKYGEDYEQALRKKAKRSLREEKLLSALDSIKNDASRASVIADLMEHGATLHFAESAYAHFGNALTTILKDNPYALCEMPGCSFKTVDERFREAYSIALTSPVRITALILYLINNAAEESGDTWIRFEALAAAANEYNISTASIELILFTRNELAFFHADDGSRYVTTKKRYETEYQIYCFSLERVSLKPCKLVSQEGITLDESQVKAVEEAISPNGSKICVINGGAGCGKTTIIKSIAQSLETANISFRLCAFAGKAAARIREATSFPASTIHSMLKYVPERGFTLDTLAGSIVIVDEASMVPASLIHAIIERRPEKLILVGDEGQLPPVGAGAPFHDLVRSGCAKTVSTCYRNTEAIFKAAYAVRNGQAPISERTKNEVFSLVGVRNAESAQDYVASILQHLDFDQDIIIAPRNGTDAEDKLPASVAQLNRIVMEYLGIPSMLVVGARILCTKNNPSAKVWNGTTGVITAIDIDGNAYADLDDGSQTKLSADYLNKYCQPAYALTIHKSQGSQYRRVVIVALRRDSATLLDRRMLYTAVTRAKAGCLVVTDTNLLSVVNQNASRCTVLSQLLSHKESNTNG